LQALLARIHHEEPARSTLLTTHDLTRGLAFASRVLILRRGKLVLDAPTEQHSFSTWRETYLELVA
jgi:ABC-type sulfate/molybdate transport systems ATPase subunit